MIATDITKEVKNTFFRHYAVILHNDEKHEFEYVVNAVAKAVPPIADQVRGIVFTAHQEGKAVVILCMREIAELYQERIQSYSLSASIEAQ